MSNSNRKRARPGAEDAEEEVRSAIALIRQLPAGGLPPSVRGSFMRPLEVPKTLTPLEKQVVAMRQQLQPHVILMVTCGYRIKFYGRDSRVASRRLGIMCIPTSPFESSSVPYVRGDLYVSRLVSMGYHVAFADQEESAAMRQADGGARGVFKRSVSRVYCRGTLLPGEFITRYAETAAAAAATTEADGAGGDEDNNPEDGDEANDAALTVMPQDEQRSYARAQGSSELYMLFMRSANASDSSVECCLVSFLRSHVVFAEVSDQLSLEDILQAHAITDVVMFDPSNSGKASVLPKPFAQTLDAALALNYGPSDHGAEDQQDVSAVVIHGNSYRADVPFVDSIATFLEAYGMADVFRRLVGASAAGTKPTHAEKEEEEEEEAKEESKPQSPSPREQKRTCSAADDAEASDSNAMQLPGTTLRALDIFSATSGSIGGSGSSPGAPAASQQRQREGSLLWLIDQTTTSMGGRLIRSWLAAPLTDVDAILSRQNAVTELLRGGDAGSRLTQLLKEASSFGDVGAVLARLQVQRCTVVEYLRLLRMVDAMHCCALEIQPALRQQQQQQQTSLAERSQRNALLSEIVGALACSTVAQFTEDHLAEVESKATTPLELFTAMAVNASGSQQSCPEAVKLLAEKETQIVGKLNDELEAARAALQMPALEYKTIAGTSFVLDVPQAKVKNALPSWTVLTRTKTNVRFHTPAIVDLNVELCATRERMSIAARDAWLQKQREITHTTLSDATSETAVAESLLGVAKRVVDAIAQLDALHSLALLAASPGYSCPLLDPSTSHVELIGTRHPVLERRMTSERPYVACDVRLARGGAWILTGPNMGGKSAIMRLVGCVSILAQMGSYVPCTRARLPVFDAVFCRMGAQDSILEGSSTFLTEMLETSRILHSGKLSSSLVLMDELGRGTSSYDGIAVAAATLEYLLAASATTLFVTHYSVLCEPYREGQRDGVECYYMGFTDREAALAPHVKKEKEENGHRANKNDSAGGPTSANGGSQGSCTITFTYQPCRGVTPSSFGVDVAAMAGLPSNVTRTASRMSVAQESTQHMRDDFSSVTAFLRE